MIKNELLAGWGEADITPYGHRVALQGQINQRVTDQVHDPLYATVLALSSQDDEAVMVSADLSFISAELERELQDYVERHIPGLDSQKVFLFAMHVHTAPYQLRVPHADKWDHVFSFKEQDPDVMTPEEYREYFVQQVGPVIGRAWQDRKKTKVATLLGYCTLGHNRRFACGEQDTPLFRGMAGPEDSGVELMYFFDEKGKPTGCIANCACPAQVVGGDHYISGDLYAQARREIWAALGEDFHMMPMLSAAGDQGPLDLIRRKDKFASMLRPEGIMELGRRLAREVVYRLEEASKTAVDTLCFAHRIAHIELPTRKVSYDEMEAARKKMQQYSNRLEDEYIGFLYAARQAVVWQYEKQKTDWFYPVKIHILRIGDSAVATNPFELFLEYGQSMKGLSHCPHVFIAQLCSAVGGYLPTARAIEIGGYSSDIVDGYCGQDAGDYLVAATVQRINQLFDQQ